MLIALALGLLRGEIRVVVLPAAHHALKQGQVRRVDRLAMVFVGPVKVIT